MIIDGFRCIRILLSPHRQRTRIFRLTKSGPGRNSQRTSTFRPTGSEFRLQLHHDWTISLDRYFTDLIPEGILKPLELVMIAI